jgi:hypothetical protein
MPPVSFSDHQLGLIAAIGRGVPVRLRFVWLNRFAQMLPPGFRRQRCRALRATGGISAQHHRLCGNILRGSSMLSVSVDE